MFGGSVWIVDFINFFILKIIVVVFVEVEFGGMREFYWYLNNDEW